MVPAVRRTGDRCMTVYVLTVTEWYLQWDGQGTGVWLCMCWLLQNGTCSETDWIQVYDCVCADCYRMVPAVRRTGYRCMTVYVLTVTEWYLQWDGLGTGVRLCMCCYRMVPAVRRTGYRRMTVYVLTVTEWYLQWDGLGTGVWLCMCWLLQNGTCSETDWVQAYACVCADCCRVVPCSEMDWVLVYDFVFDRLRAVRQDAVLQALKGPELIVLLEHIVRFYIYAGYRWSGFCCTVTVPHLTHGHVYDVQSFFHGNIFRCDLLFVPNVHSSVTGTRGDHACVLPSQYPFENLFVMTVGSTLARQ